MDKINSIRKKVLVVDDNEVNQDVIGSMVTRLGFDVSICSNGGEAINAVQMEQFAVVLMDCQMPAMSGFDATKEIRKLEGSSRTHVPVIAITASHLEGDYKEALDAGMDDFLPKPIQLDGLEQTLNKWVISSVCEKGDSTAAQTLTGTALIDEVVVSELTELAPDNDPLFMRRLVEKFIVHVKQNLLDFDSALAESNTEKVKRVAHTMKGSCRTMGAQRAANLWETIESEVNQGHLEMAAQFQRELGNEMTKVFIYFESAFFR